MLWILLMLLADSRMVVPDVYHPLHREMVALDNERGTLFVLSYSESHVKRFAADGSLLEPVSTKGEGPGELDRPRSLMWFKGSLYVQERNRISRFDHEGRYLDMIAIRAPATHLRLAKGWAYTRSNDQGRVHLLRTDERVGDETKLIELGPSGGVFIRQVDTIMTFDYNPAPEQGFARSSPDGRTLYCYVSDSMTLIIFDGETLKERKRIRLPGQRIPFNRDWGQQQIRTMTENFKVNGQNAPSKITPQFPKFFPRIGEMVVDEQGRCWLRDGIALVDAKKGETLVYDRDGKQHKPAHSFQAQLRSPGSYQGKMFLFCFDQEEEEVFILRCDPAEVDTLAEKWNDSGEDGFNVTFN